MTFSIVGRSDTGDAWGVAVASKFLAVGSAVPAGAAGAGALATQAMANLSYRGAGLALLAQGRPAEQVVAALTEADAERAHRQLGVVDARGGSAGYTGASCFPWAGHRVGAGYACQGNILTGPQVLEAVERTWLDGAGLALPHRLLAALQAGDAAGGDRRGRQSAALLVLRAGAGYGGLSDVEMDLRVDDHPDPCAELGRLVDLHDLYFGTPEEASLLELEGELADEVRERLARLGYATLQDWAGVENYEMRMVPGRIDPLVLGKLREATS